MSELSDFLSTVAPFSELDRKAIGDIVEFFDEREFSAGDRIGRFEQPGRHGLYLIARGAVALQSLEGEELEQRGETELFGHAIALDSTSAGYQVRAIEDCRIWQIEADNLARVVQRHHQVGQFLSAGPGERLRSISARNTGTLADLTLRKPVTTGPDQSIAACAALMADHQVSALPVVHDGRLIGIVTDRDLRSRVLARGVDPATSVEKVMTAQPASVLIGNRIDDALVEMMRLGVHHLPVLGQHGELVSVVSAGDLARMQSPHPLRLVRDIQRAGTVSDLAALARQGPGMLANLANRGSQVTEVGRMASMITDACTKRLLVLAGKQLGDAPFAWTWLAFGSQARMEQGLISDQDNGLLLAEEPEGEAADYFQRLSELVCDGLNDCGYIHCPGGVMAKGRWRLSLAAWRRTFDRWMLEPDPQSVMNSSIFFDLRPVAGDPGLAERLHTEVLKRAADSKIFLRFLAAESMQHRPPIGLFRQFVQETDGQQSQGLNLKKRGVLPIVDLARVRALEGAIKVVHTEERLQTAAREGHMNANDADDLIHALRFIGNVRLRHQARLYEQGQKPNHLVDPEALSGLHRRYLRSAFGIVRSAQKALDQRYMLY